MRLIDADELIKHMLISAINAPLPKSIGGKELPRELVQETYGVIIQYIESASTVEIRQKGKWVDDGTGVICKCSECGGTSFGDQLFGGGYFKFCPNCGADMRGGD